MPRCPVCRTRNPRSAMRPGARRRFPEPLPASAPYWDVPNLIITPHCSSDDIQQYVPRTLELVFDNLERLVAGKPLRCVVDPKLEY